MEISMQIKESFFCKYEDGTAIWFAPDAVLKPGYYTIETRKLLFPETGKVLRLKKDHKVFSSGTWLKDTAEEDWEEVDASEIEILDN